MYAYFRIKHTLFVFFLLAILTISSPLSAQFIRRVPGASDPNEKPPQPFKIDIDLAKIFQQADEAIESSDYELGIRLLQRYVLGREEDLFYLPDALRKNRILPIENPNTPPFAEPPKQTVPTGEKNPFFKGSKQVAEDKIGALPRKGKKLYQQLYGGQASQLLKKGTSAGDWEAIQEVAQRYFHTDAGAKATYLLGIFALDHGDTLLASRQFQKLVRWNRHQQWDPWLSLKLAICQMHLGDGLQAKSTLVRLKKRSGNRKLQLGGKTISFFEKEQNSLRWLESIHGLVLQKEIPTAQKEWLLFRGDVNRNGVTSVGSLPGTPAWKFDALSFQQHFALLNPQLYEEKIPVIRKELNRLLKENQEASRLTMPCSHPLLIENQLVFRGIDGIVKRLDIRSGTLIGETLFNSKSIFAELVESRDPYHFNVDLATENNAALGAFLDQRAWRDQSAGTISSDGQLLYVLEDLGFLGIPNQYQNMLTPLAPQTWNRLSAYDFETGNLLWQAGGPNDQKQLPLSGHFILGPPLPLNGYLYCLTEYQNEMFLVCLKSIPNQPQPRLVWKQSLLIPQVALEQNGLRRVAGLSPSYAEGILLCPTASQMLLGFDLHSRRLLWGYQYGSPNSTDSTIVPGFPFGVRGARVSTSLPKKDRWLDSAPIVSGGKVIFTPQDSGELHCLSLVDGGKLQWKKPRLEGIYVAGVFENCVIVVGRNYIRAYHLNTGNECWNQPIPIPLPAGRGYATGTYYHLPLSTGEIATINLEQGVLQARSLGPEGWIPGNLLSINGILVSQSVNQLMGFPALNETEIEMAKQLESNPQHHLALAQRGELLLRQGETEAGLVDLETSLKHQPNRHASSMYIERVLEGLRVDFEQFEPRYHSLENFEITDSQQKRLHNIYADGLIRVQRFVEAFESYLQLAKLNASQPQGNTTSVSVLQTIDSLWSVREQSRIRQKIATLESLSSPSDLSQINRTLKTYAEEVMLNNDPAQLRSFVESFGHLSVADSVRDALLTHLNPKKQAIEMEWLLQKLMNSENEELAGFATARLIDLYLSLDKTSDVGRLVPLLKSRFKQVDCLDGKTGAELASIWEDTFDAKATWEQNAKMWPKRRFEATAALHRVAFQTTYPISHQLPQSEYYRGWTFHLDAQRRYLHAVDPNGKLRWKFDVRRHAGNVYTHLNYSISSFNHILLVQLHDRFLVLDGLQSPSEPVVLWKEVPQRNEVSSSQVQMQIRLGGIRAVRVLPNGTVISNLSNPQQVVHVHSNRVIYLSGTELRSANLMTGELFWVQKNVDASATFLGDEEFVFVVQNEGSFVVSVYRAIDGEFVTSLSLDIQGEVLHASHRQIVFKSPAGAHLDITALDTLTGKRNWKQSFPVQSVLSQVCENHLIGVYDPTGQLTVLDLNQGQTLTQMQLRKEKDLGSFGIYLMKKDEAYILLTSRNNNPFARIAFPTGRTAFQPNGPAYGLNVKDQQVTWSLLLPPLFLGMHQPANVPLLILTRQSLRPGEQNRYGVTILDTRNGHIVHQKNSSQHRTYYQMEVDSIKQEVRLQFYQERVTLKLTSKPLDLPKQLLKPDLINHPIPKGKP